MLIYFVLLSVVAIFDFVENKMHLGIKNKCKFILYFARLLLSLQLKLK